MTLEIHFLLVPRGLAFKDALGAGRCITGGFSGSLILFHLSPWTLLVHSTFGLKTDPKKVWAKIDMTIWMDFLTSSSWRLLYSLSRKKWVKLKTESMLRIWVFPKIMVPPNHPMFNGVWNHYFHHPFWGTHPYFWKHPYSETWRWCMFPPSRGAVCALGWLFSCMDFPI